MNPHDPQEQSFHIEVVQRLARVEQECYRLQGIERDLKEVTRQLNLLTIKMAGIGGGVAVLVSVLAHFLGLSS